MSCIVLWLKEIDMSDKLKAIIDDTILPTIAVIGTWVVVTLAIMAVVLTGAFVYNLANKLV